MKYRTLRKWHGAVGGLLGLAAALAVALDKWAVLIGAVPAAMVLLYLLRRRVREIYTDERTYAIAYKAARLTVGVVAVGMALVGGLLLLLGRGGASPELTHTGLAFEYATCALLIINQFAYYYYEWKMSGRP